MNLDGGEEILNLEDYARSFTIFTSIKSTHYTIKATRTSVEEQQFDISRDTDGQGRGDGYTQDGYDIMTLTRNLILSQNSTKLLLKSHLKPDPNKLET
ncbi:hypothetical protein RDI58_007699 [Solanum bulbocastanum]|uniref:Uncharacterized protein n=1 Tax=Solanum bulbocastanum TaxID=147425 RepID=A0AAN8YJI0_SOLBU